MTTRNARAWSAIFILGIAITTAVDLTATHAANDASEFFGYVVAIDVAMFAVGLSMFAYNIATFKRSKAGV